MSIEALLGDLIEAVKENTVELRNTIEQRERLVAQTSGVAPSAASEASADKPKRGRPTKEAVAAREAKVETKVEPEPEQEEPTPAAAVSRTLDPVEVGAEARAWISEFPDGSKEHIERREGTKAILAWLGKTKVKDLDADELAQFAAKFQELKRTGKVDLNADADDNI